MSRVVKGVRVQWFVVTLLVIMLTVSGVVAAEKVKLVYSTGLTPEQFGVLQWAVDTFMELNPDIEVELQGRGTYDLDKLMTQLAGGVVPDLIDQPPNGVEPLIRGGYLLDVTERVNRSSLGFNTDAYVPASEIYYSDGRVMGGLETHFQLYPMYYNVDLMQEAGLADPNSLAVEDWNWTTFLDYAKKLSVDRDGDGVLDRAGFAHFANNWEIGWLPWVLANDGDLFSPDRTHTTILDENVIEALEFYVALYREHRVAEYFGPVLFDNETAAMMITGTWYQQGLNAIGVNFNWDIINPPINKGMRFSRSPASAAVIAKDSKHPDEAWRFIEFLLGPVYQGRLAETKLSIPVLKSALIDYTSPPPRSAPEVITRMVQYSEPIIPWPGYYDAMARISDHLWNALEGNQSVRVAMEEAVDPINAILAQYYQ